MNDVIFFKIDPGNDELLFAGTSEYFGSGQRTGPGAIELGDLVLLSDVRSHPNPLFPPKIRAVNKCVQDLNSDGSLNFLDLSLYNSMLSSGDLQADYAAPWGVLNFDDLTHYLKLYNLGCP